MKLLLIRHGDPNYEADCLTDKGKKQAEFLSQRLILTEQIQEIYTSPMGRAIQTAQFTAEKLNLELRILPWLHEFAVTMPVPYQDTPDYPFTLRADYWNSICNSRDPDHSNILHTGVLERIQVIEQSFQLFLESYGLKKDGYLFRIVDSHKFDGRTIALFCHAGISGLLLSLLLNVPILPFWNTISIPTTGVSSIQIERIEPKSTHAHIIIPYIGDTMHLYHT